MPPEVLHQQANRLDRYCTVRGLTEALAAPLSPEDQTVQSMPDVSPTKWHRAHTTWFFEEFVLGPHLSGYEPVEPSYRFHFNSYYEAVGPRQERAARGVITRPSVAEVGEYRRRVDESMAALLSEEPCPELAALVELGLNHEQQHQELLLMDIKHVLAQNVTDPVYRASRSPGGEPTALGWVAFDGGPHQIGFHGSGFSYDNESPRHTAWLEPFEIADRPITNGDVLAFMVDGGYGRSDLWLSDGWAAVRSSELTAPLYWRHDERSSDASGPSDPSGWTTFTLGGRRSVNPNEPACHLSYYEADAIAHWMGARLPTEAEWEVAAAQRPAVGNLLDLDGLHPLPTPARADDRGIRQLYGAVWEWTASAYLPYPGFRPAEGAVGEYNGKFMSGQHVLRGGSCVTPPGHIRASYRNFFPPGARWAFSGARLARDVER